MARNDGRAPHFEITLGDVEIGPADAAGVHIDEDFIGRRLGARHIYGPQGVRLDGRRNVQKHRTHEAGS
jgi:hypothetical protein